MTRQRIQNLSRDFLLSSDDDDSYRPRPPRWGDGSADTLSDSDSDFQGPQDQQDDGWSNGPSHHNSGSSVASMMDNLDADLTDIQILQQYIIPDDQSSDMSDNAVNIHYHILEVQHPDQWIRDQAQHNIRDLL